MSLFARITFILCVSVFFASSVWAETSVSLRAGYQMLKPSGDIAGSSSSFDTSLDIDDDLDWDESREMLGELSLNWERSQLSFSYLPIEFSGDSLLTLDGYYNGQAFSIGDHVSSDVKFDLYDVGYTFYLINMKEVPTPFRLGVEFAIKLADIEIEFSDEAAGIHENDSVIAPLPTLGIRTCIALTEHIALTGRAGYIEYDENHLFDANVQLEYLPLKQGGLFAGYRYFDLVVDESDVDVNLEFSGPYAGIMIHF
ncbi:hypothetical protein [uncultured Desulfuromonas sp.]|uniref:hypothetical protein n=1 Tax=uncultured Desulfuromonas sp. TaxID=181013 RepID=UPI002AAAA2D7|nr:hypothetical protein [uncultured Desulfuromonas sp.]